MYSSRLLLTESPSPLLQPLCLHFGESCAVNDIYIFFAKKPFLVGEPSQTTSCWRADREIPIHDGEAGVN